MTLNQKRNEGIQVTEGQKTQLRQAIGVGIEYILNKRPEIFVIYRSFFN
jgi:hypothetical protein